VGSNTSTKEKGELNQPPLRPDTIRKLAFNVFPSIAMMAAVKLEIFTHLSEGTMDAEEVADSLGVNASRLRPLLYALVAYDLLKVKDGRFSNTPEADHFLSSTSPDYMGHTLELWESLWGVTDFTVDSIRTGEPKAKHDYSKLPKEELENVLGLLHHGTVMVARQLLIQYDFSDYRTLIDVGGGTGGLAITIAEQCPNIQATVLELPNVAYLTQNFIDKSGISDRLKVVAADVVHDSLSGSYDVAVLKALIQVLSPDEGQIVLRNVYNILEPGGRIFIVGRILDDSHTAPLIDVAFSLVMLNVYEKGQAFTEGEYRDWLMNAGFKDIQRNILPNHFQIITASKPK
jgi:SAM-dependent methyltransferase